MKILLGHRGEYFNYIKFLIDDALDYADFIKSYEETNPDIFIGWHMLDIISYMIEQSTEIIFLLDNVRAPIDSSNVVTHFELKMIIDNSSFFEKTTFSLKNKEIKDATSSKILNIIRSNVRDNS